MMLGPEGPLGPIERYLSEKRLVMSSRIMAESDVRQSPQCAALGEPVTIWDGMRRGGAIPHKRDLRPERFGRFLPKISILDVDFVNRDFRWALHGGEHEYWLGGSLKSRRASDIPGKAMAELREQAVTLAGSGKPGYLLIRYSADGDPLLSAHILTLPVAVEQQGCGMLLCPTIFTPHGERPAV